MIRKDLLITFFKNGSDFQVKEEANNDYYKIIGFLKGGHKTQPRFYYNIYYIMDILDFEKDVTEEVEKTIEPNITFIKNIINNRKLTGDYSNYLIEFNHIMNKNDNVENIKIHIKSRSTGKKLVTIELHTSDNPKVYGEDYISIQVHQPYYNSKSKGKIVALTTLITTSMYTLPSFTRVFKKVHTNTKKIWPKLDLHPQLLMYSITQLTMVAIPKAIKEKKCKKKHYTTGTLLTDKGLLKLKGVECKTVLGNMTEEDIYDASTLYLVYKEEFMKRL